MKTTHVYGTDVLEFFLHDDAELQELIDKAERQYFSRSEGLHHKGLAAYIDFNRDKPLRESLIDMEEFTQQGYKIHMVDYRPLLFTCTLRKPAHIIEAELPKLTELAKEEYAELRYASNVAETAKQLEISVTRRAQEAAEAVAKAAAEHKAAEHKAALEELLRAHSRASKAKAKQQTEETA